MNERCRKLLEAHVAFELRQWQGPSLRERLAQETGAFWRWAQTTPLTKLGNAEPVSAAARRLLIETDLPDGLAAMIGGIAKHLIALPVNRQTRLSDIVGDELFGVGVNLTVELRRLREEVIRRSIESPLYATLVSEVLYQGIKDFLLSENSLAQRIPGVSLLSKGAGALGRRIPNLENQLERRLRGFIESHLNHSVQQSEHFLMHTLDDERVRKMSTEVWHGIQDSPLLVTDVLNDDEVDKIAAFGLRVWLELRRTEYFDEMIREGIERFFALCGDRLIGDLLETIGIAESVLQREVIELVSPLADALRRTGYLETAIRRRLELFYGSAEAQQAAS